jgi:hypothetical protein
VRRRVRGQRLPLRSYPEENNPLSILHLPATADVLVLYSGISLSEQIGVWAARHPDWQVETSFERSLPEIRTLLRSASVTIVDATEDPSQATDAFLQAVARLGATAVAMYSEAMHDGLELFVRVRGSLYLLGPLSNEQWEEFFERPLRTKGIAPASWGRVPRRLTSASSHGRGERQPERFIHRFRTGIDRPSNDVN